MSSQKRLLDPTMMLAPAGWHPAHFATKVSLPRWYQTSSFTSFDGVSRRLVLSSGDNTGAMSGFFSAFFWGVSAGSPASSADTAAGAARATDARRHREHAAAAQAGVVQEAPVAGSGAGAAAGRRGPAATVLT